MGRLHNMQEQWRSISKFYQVSEQKDFRWGAAECEPTQWNAWRLVRGFQSTSSWRTRPVRLHEPRLDAQSIPNSIISPSHQPL